MKYAVLGPIGLIEFIIRVAFYIIPVALSVITDELDVEEVNEAITPYCWKLLEDPNNGVNLRK